MSVDANLNLSKTTSVSRGVSTICRMLTVLSTTLLISMHSGALAQDQTTPPRVSPVMSSDEQDFVVNSDLAMSKMSLDMSSDPTGDVDHDFVALMLPHAQGAIDVARAELRYGHSEYLQRLAKSIIAEREGEISNMRSGIGNPSHEHP